MGGLGAGFVARREHDPRLDHVDGRGDPGGRAAGEAGTQGGDAGAFEDAVDGAAALLSPALREEVGFEVFEGGELEAGEGEVARCESGVAPP